MPEEEGVIKKTGWQLIGPEKKSEKPLNPQELKSLKRSALLAFQGGMFEEIFSAQKYLVQAVEGAPYVRLISNYGHSLSKLKRILSRLQLLRKSHVSLTPFLITLILARQFFCLLRVSTKKPEAY